LIARGARHVLGPTACARTPPSHRSASRACTAPSHHQRGRVDQQDGSDGEALLRIAGGLLYEAKAQGCDRIQVTVRVAEGSASVG
jgi:hypothetical protein